MPSSTQIGRTIKSYGVRAAKGLLILYTNTLPDNNSPEFADTDCVSGSSVGTSIVPDLLPTATYPIPIETLYNGTKGNPYPTGKWYGRELTLSVNGATAWAGGTALVMQDTNLYPMIYIPIIALASLAKYVIPVSNNPLPQQATIASGGYNATTGVMTFPASTFITTTLAGVPFSVVDGTGKGQTGIILSNTATTITPTTILKTPLDSTSVIAVWYYAASAGSGTTIVSSNITWGDLSNGWSVVIVSGTGFGQVRKITSATSHTITVPTWTTNPDSTSVFAVTQAPQQMGIVDLTFGSLTSGCTPGAGVQWNTVGTFNAGSPIRWNPKGFWGFAGT